MNTLQEWYFDKYKKGESIQLEPPRWDLRGIQFWQALTETYPHLSSKQKNKIIWECYKTDKWVYGE